MSGSPEQTRVNMKKGSAVYRVFLTAVVAFALGAAPAAASRSTEATMPPFNQSWTIAFDGSGHPWVTDFGQNGLLPPGNAGFYKYDPYPSQNLLAVPQTYAIWSRASLFLQVAVDKSTEDVVIAQSNGRIVSIWDNDANYLRSWKAINGLRNSNGIGLAIDNTSSDSGGRVYVSLSTPENNVEAYDLQQRPVQFPAKASYIDENRITGTPAGPFGRVGPTLWVDEDGNLFVTDTTKNEVFEYDPTGEFKRAFPAPAADPGNFSGNPPIGGVATDPTDGTIAITESQYNPATGQGGVAEFDQAGNLVGRIQGLGRGVPAFDPSGRLYVPIERGVQIYGPNPKRPTIEYAQVSGETTTGGTLHATVDPAGGGSVSSCKFQYGTNTTYSMGTMACTPDPAVSPPGSNFAVPTDVTADLAGLTSGTRYHYRVVVAGPNGTSFGEDRVYTPQGVVGLRTEPASGMTESTAELAGSLLGDGSQTNYLFEWGRTTSYGQSTASPPGDDAGTPSGPGRTALSSSLSGLDPYTTYHYRVVATGGSGTSYGEDEVFTTTPGVPEVGGLSISEVHSDRADLHAEIVPHGGRTEYHFEYVDDENYQESGFAEAIKAPDGPAGQGKNSVRVSATVDGLKADTIYHYRAMAQNSAGIGVPNVDRTFRTFKFGYDDSCPNVHVRQQTGAAYLLDCRAYELASARNAGGYDVESDLIPGQTPYGDYPLATGPSKLLYGVHDGGIPGTGRTTNHGVDPYLATRGDDGWTTRYIGIPADNPFAIGSFASTVDEADSSLDTYGFGGPEPCSPCFADGSTGVPVRLPDGTLVQGMKGSLNPGPGAEPSGHIGKHLSADGSHFVFGSTSQFEPDGNSNGDVSIYDRNLISGETHVVSKNPEGGTMTGTGIGELDISSSGDRILIGRQVSTDSAGNRYWHLYMNVGDSAQTIDLMAGNTEGALFSGMSADGTAVYFTTPDTPSGVLGGDGDTSADIFRADVSSTAATITRVSTGEAGSGETDSCTPEANTQHTYWNSLAGTPNCDVLAIGGGGGVASSGHGIYFMSPEKLDASDPENEPVDGAPNVYVARPGSATKFVATLESTANAPLPPFPHPFKKEFGSYGNPTGTAIDASNGDIYALDIGIGFPSTGKVFKYDSEGNQDSSFGGGGEVTFAGAVGLFGMPTKIAVDNYPASPNYRDLFVPTLLGESVAIYSPSGVHVSDLTGVPLPSAVAVDPSTGYIYVASFAGIVFVYEPDGTFANIIPVLGEATDIAVDSSGNMYVSNGGASTVPPAQFRRMTRLGLR